MHCSFLDGGMSALKKIICILLSVSLAVFPVLPVFAEEPGDVGKSFVKLKYVLTQLGCVFSGNLDEMISNSEKFQAFEDGNIVTSDDGKGSVTIDNSTVNNIYNVAKEEVTKLNGYYLVEPAQSVADFFFSMSNGYDFSVLEKWKTTFKEYTPDGLVFPYQNGAPYARLPAYPVVGCFISGEEAMGYSTTKGAVQFGVSYYKTGGFGPYGWEKPTTGMSVYNVTVEEFKTKLICDSPVKLFYTQQDLLYYVNYGGRVYLTNNFNNYANSYDHSITYKDNVINNTDWSQVNHNIYNNIYNNYQDTPEDERQDLIDMKYDEIISALGDIGGNVEDMNKTLSRWLERIYKKVDGIYSKIENFKVGEIPQEVIKNISDMLERLERMHQQLLFVVENLSVINGKFNDLLTNLGTFPDFLSEKFEILTKAVENIKVSGGGGLGGFLGNALGNLLGDLLDKIINGGEEAVADAVEELATTFAPMVDVSKTKFPFSIPWDFQKIIVLLAADPEVPKLEIPFSLPNYGFKQNIDIDLSSFEGVSKISRSFFTVMFVISLMTITIKLMGKGGE